MNETLKILHVLSVAAWIGAGFYNAFLGPRIAGAGGNASLAWVRGLSDAAVKYFMPAGVRPGPRARRRLRGVRSSPDS